MKVRESEYLKQKKPILKKLLEKLLLRYEYASILANDSKSMNYGVSKTGTHIVEDGTLTERGFCVKIFDHGKASEYSFNSIDENTIDAVYSEIEHSIEELGKTLPKGTEVYEYKDLDEEDLFINESTEYKVDPEEKGDDEIIGLLSRISEKGLKYDKRIVNCSVSFSYQKYSKIFLSKKKDLTQNIMWACGYIATVAKEGEELQSGYKPVSMLGGIEVLDPLEEKLEDACRVALELLDAEPITPGEYECICEPDVTGMIVHEAFGHGVEMDMFVKDRAQAKEFIGKQVASELITMHDGASTIPQVATYFFDDEGIPAHDTIIIEKGILKTGICDYQSAKHLGISGTGNGRRQDTSRKAYTRMTNTIFEAGTSKVSDMIASIKDGFLLCQASSGMEDPKNWGIQLMVDIAREIKDGKLTGKIFSPIVLTGYVPDLLKSITMISDESEAGGTGYCGKGYKEWVKVSDGGPYIKARIRLG